MKNRKIIDSLNKIGPGYSADKRMLSAILAENRRVREEMEDTMKINRKKVRKRALALAAAAILILSLTIGVGATGAFGRLFSFITQKDKPGDYNADNLDLIAEHMEPVTDEVTATQKGGLKFSVREAYYDGMTLYSVGEIETETDPNADYTSWDFDVFINGVKIDFDFSLISREWVKTEDGKYISDAISTKIPGEYRPEGAGDIRVKYVATHYSYGGEYGSTELGIASSEFTVAFNDEKVSISETVMQNDIKFRYYSSSLATTEICMDVPRELAGYDSGIFSDIGLLTEDGRCITLNTGITTYSDEDPDHYWRLTYSGEAVPEGVTQLIAQIITYDETNQSVTVTAEFCIDLVEKSVSPVV